MTVASSTSRSDYTGNGVTTAFTGAFRILDQTHIIVYRTQISTGAVTTLALTTDYTVSGVGGTSFTVTCLVAPTSDQRISILRNVPLTQASSYPLNDVFSSTTTENALDKLTMMTQQLNEAQGRALSLPAITTGVSTSLPVPTANQIIGWNGSASGLTNYDPTNLGVNIYSAAWRTQTFNGDGVTTAFVLTQDAGVASNCAVSVAGVVQAAGINYSYNSTTKTITFLTGAPPSGTNNVVVRYGQALPAGTVAAASITDSTVTGRALVTTADAAAARSTLGLVIGTNVAAAGANGDITSLSALASINGGQIAGMRNKLINGSMAVDQRNAGASQTFTAAAALAYSVDRWYGYCTGANVTGQRVSGTAPNKFNYRFTGAASVTKIGFAQRIEAANCQDLAGQTATLSVDLANSLLTTVTWTAWYANTEDTFGTLASPTRTQIATGTFTVSSTLTRYSTQISIPSAATTGIEVEFSVGAQTSGTWTIGRAQLELGSVATSFEVRPIGAELSLCQRYLPSTQVANGEVLSSGYVLNSGNFQASYKFSSQPRVAPTGITVSAPANFTVVTPGSTTAASGLAFSQAGVDGALITVSSSGMTAGQPGFMRATGSSSFYFTGCEL